MNYAISFAVELGDMNLESTTSTGEIVWFVVGLLLLTGLTIFVLWWHRRGRPDPFAQ